MRDGGSDGDDPDQQRFDDELRPSRLEDVVGQKAVVERLLILLEATKRRKEPLGHLLLDGPPGLGKTTLATVVPRELGEHRAAGQADRHDVAPFDDVRQQVREQRAADVVDRAPEAGALERLVAQLELGDCAHVGRPESAQPVVVFGATGFPAPRPTV